MGTLSYSPSASSLPDMPVAPYPVGSFMGSIDPSLSSSELRPESVAESSRESFSTRIPFSKNTSSGSLGSIFSKGSAPVPQAHAQAQNSGPSSTPSDGGSSTGHVSENPSLSWSKPNLFSWLLLRIEFHEPGNAFLEWYIHLFLLRWEPHFHSKRFQQPILIFLVLFIEIFTSPILSFWNKLSFVDQNSNPSLPPLLPNNNHRKPFCKVKTTTLIQLLRFVSIYDDPIFLKWKGSDTFQAALLLFLSFSICFLFSWCVHLSSRNRLLYLGCWSYLFDFKRNLDVFFVPPSSPIMIRYTNAASLSKWGDFCCCDDIFHCLINSVC